MDTARKDDGSTPLFMVVENGHGAVVSRLIAAGAYANKVIQKTNGATPLFIAARRGYTAIVAQLSASV